MKNWEINNELAQDNNILYDEIGCESESRCLREVEKMDLLLDEDYCESLGL